MAESIESKENTKFMMMIMVIAMAKTTFYFVIITLVIVDLIQSRYQRKLLAQKNREISNA